MQTNPITPSLSKILASLPAQTPIQVRSGRAQAGNTDLPEQDAIRLAVLAAQRPGLTVGFVQDLLLTGVYHRLRLHTRKQGVYVTGAGAAPLVTHSLGLRDSKGNSIPMANLEAEVKAVHAGRMKNHGTKQPAKIVNIQGRTVAVLADGKRMPVAHLVANRVAIGGTYPMYIATFRANGRAMQVAVPQPDQEIPAQPGATAQMPRRLARQVQARSAELRLEGQLAKLGAGGTLTLGNFALQD